MKIEHPQPFIVRLYKKHRTLIKQGARKHRCSQAQFVRDAIIEATINLNV
jgi:hypothetical protein